MREVGDRQSEAITLMNLAMVLIMQGNGTAARAMILDALPIAEETRSRPLAQSVLEVSAGLAALERDWNRVARFFGAAEAHASKTGVRRDPADEAFLAPRVDLARTALGEAAFHESERLGSALDDREALHEARSWLRAPANLAANASVCIR